MPNRSELHEIAVLAAKAAGRVLNRHMKSVLNISEKKNAGLVTQVDLEAEDAVIRVLKKYTPEFDILAEESGIHRRKESGPNQNRWIVDPLDGTTNYVHGFPMFCSSIAAEVKGDLVVGAIYHPPLKDLYTAMKGKGAWINGERMKVSKSKKIKESLLTTGFGYQSESWLTDEMAIFKKMSSKARAIRRPGSACLDLAYVARGIFDGFWESHLSPWDMAAGAIMVREAGGQISNHDGSAFVVDTDNVLATNGSIHEEMIGHLRSSS